jgi:Protein of unknown function (DUF3800)
VARKFLFADEAGDFNFSPGPNVSRYFIVCTVTMDTCDVAHDLLELRRELVWKKQPVGDYFHATVDKQSIRDAVYEGLQGHKFQIQATIMEKAKAQPQISSTNHRFYQYGWLYHFRFGIAPHIQDVHEYLITAASIGTKKGRAVFTNAINDVVQQHLKRENWRTAFWPCGMDPCLQVADYCTWAIQRKWERNDCKAFDLIKDRLSYEYDLWARGTRLFY